MNDTEIVDLYWKRNERAVEETAKKYGLLLVPSDSFGIKGYVRISYCVSYDMISRSLPYFKELMGEFVR